MHALFFYKQRFFLELSFECCLTHSFSMYPFSIPWKHQKILRFSDVFKEVEKSCIGKEWVKCCLLHIDMILHRCVIFCIFLSMFTSRSINYKIYFSLSFSFSLPLIIESHLNFPTCLFGPFCQKFSHRELLSFCLIFCQFQPGVTNKRVSYRKSVYLI